MLVQVETLPCPANNPGMTFAPPPPALPAPDPYAAAGVYLTDTMATYHPYSPGGLVVSSLYCADAFLGEREGRSCVGSVQHGGRPVRGRGRGGHHCHRREERPWCLSLARLPHACRSTSRPMPGKPLHEGCMSSRGSRPCACGAKA